MKIFNYIIRIDKDYSSSKNPAQKKYIEKKKKGGYCVIGGCWNKTKSGSSTCLKCRKKARARWDGRKR